MKTKLRLSYAIFSSALVWSILGGSSLLAGTLLVDDDKVECPGAGFNSIQAAVDAAAPGDTVQVCPGTYDEQVEIAKPLTLTGVERNGKNAAVVQPSNLIVNTDLVGFPTAAVMLVRDTLDVTIKNITVDGINNGIVCGSSTPYINGIFYRNASGEIASVAIKNMRTPADCPTGDGLDIQGTEGESHVTVKDSSVHDYDFGGIYSVGAGLSVDVIRNVVTGRGGAESGEAGIQLDGATGSIEQNIVTAHLTAGCPDCNYLSSNISVFDSENASVVGNILGSSNVGIYLGSNNVSVLQNRVLNAELYDGIIVIGGDNVVQGNHVTDSDYLGVFLEGANNTLQDNAINEARIGILASTGNSIFHNRIFNTKKTVKSFSLAAPERPTPLTQTAIAPLVARKALRK